MLLRYVLKIFFYYKLVAAFHHRISSIRVAEDEREQVEEVDISAASAFLLRYVNLVAIRETLATLIPLLRRNSPGN